MPAAAAASKPAKRVRVDPTPRHVDAELPLMKLVNKDEHYDYCCVYKHGADVNSVRYYKMIGWEVCLTPDENDKRALNFATGADSQPGAPLEQMDHIAMRIPKERRAEIESQGALGVGGQQAADALEQGIIKNRTAQDFVRGINQRFGQTLFGAKNFTRPESSLREDEAQGDVFDE